VSDFCFQRTTTPALSHKPTAWRFLMILAPSYRFLFSFFELVIIPLVKSRQSMWAAIYIAFLKCVKCATQNIVIILLNYICKWDVIVSILRASKKLGLMSSMNISKTKCVLSWYCTKLTYLLLVTFLWEKSHDFCYTW
jgi:hypothetical protein